MQQVLKQSTAATTIVGPILDTAGAAYTGAVIADLNLTKNGTTAAMAAAATLTHDHNGHYILVMTTGNTDTLGRLDVTCNKATYAMPPKCFEVLAAAAFDTLVTNGTLAGTTAGRTIVTDAAGLVDANTVKLGPTGAGTAQTAKDVGGAVPAVAAGASGGLLISGSNAGTTTFGALTCTGAFTISGGVVVTTSGTHGVSITGNGSGSGLIVFGGATGHGIRASGGATSGDGISAWALGTGTGMLCTGASGRGFWAVGSGAFVGAEFLGGSTGGGFAALGGGGNVAGIVATGVGSGPGLDINAGATGVGVDIAGGGTSGVGLSIATTSGDAISVLPTAGNGLVVTANGTSKHGFVITGGTAGVSDGVKAVAGTGGVDIRGAITGNVTGNLSGSAGSVSGAVGSVTGNVGGNVVGSVASVTADVGVTQAGADKVWSTTTRQLTGTQTFNLTGNVTGNLSGSVGSVTGAVGSVTGAVGSVGTGGIVAATFATGAINAAALATDAADEIRDSVWAKAMTELASVPGVTGSVLQALEFCFLLSRNKITQTATTQLLRNDADAGTIATATLSDDATTFIRGKMT